MLYKELLSNGSVATWINEITALKLTISSRTWYQPQLELGSVLGPLLYNIGVHAIYLFIYL